MRQHTTVDVDAPGEGQAAIPEHTADGIAERRCDEYPAHLQGLGVQPAGACDDFRVLQFITMVQVSPWLSVRPAIQRCSPTLILCAPAASSRRKVTASSLNLNESQLMPWALGSMAKSRVAGPVMCTLSAETNKGSRPRAARRRARRASASGSLRVLPVNAGLGGQGPGVAGRQGGGGTQHRANS